MTAPALSIIVSYHTYYRFRSADEIALTLNPVTQNSGQPSIMQFTKQKPQAAIRPVDSLVFF